MSRPLDLPVRPVTRTAARAAVRLAHRGVTLAAAVVVAAGAISAPAAAQVAAPTATAPNRYATVFELRPYVGAFVPTGDQRDLLKDAVFTGAQVGYGLTPHLALTGSFGWSPSKDRTGAPGLGGVVGTRLGEQKLDVYQYDLAVEGRLPAALTLGGNTAWPWHVSPFAALGAGGRTYDYRDVNGADTQTQFVGLGALGLEVGPANSPVRLRVEGRDYVSAFKGLQGERADRTARNDLTFAAGLTVGFGGRRNALR